MAEWIANHQEDIKLCSVATLINGGKTFVQNRFSV